MPVFKFHFFFVRNKILVRLSSRITEDFLPCCTINKIDRRPKIHLTLECREIKGCVWGGLLSDVTSTYVHHFCVLARHCNGCYLSVQATDNKVIEFIV